MDMLGLLLLPMALASVQPSSTDMPIVLAQCSSGTAAQHFVQGSLPSNLKSPSGAFQLALAQGAFSDCGLLPLSALPFPFGFVALFFPLYAWFALHHPRLERLK